MPAPALASPSPLTVLVLAWDAATPAVRTLIETAPGLVPASLGPVLILVPPAVDLAPAPFFEPPATQVAPTALADAPPTIGAPVQAADSTSRLAEPLKSVALPAALAAWEAAPAPAASPRRPAVRVTQLVYAAPSGRSQLAALAPTQVPAVPYLGATPLPAAPTSMHSAEAVAPMNNSPAEAGRLPSTPSTNVVRPASSGTPAPVPVAPETYHSEAYATEEALAPDLEADLLPAAASQDIPPLAPAQPASAATAFEAADQAIAIQPDVSDGLSLDGEALAAPAPILPSAEELVFAETDELPVLTVFAEDDSSPAQTPPAGSPTETQPAAVASPPLQPAAASYPAPDLNTQVIRYARFAVPAALAEGPFGAIYAPAWPTWLAALELRQRTGCPLVLHLSALAAGRAPADTAAGWPAEVQRQALRQADVVLAETYALARRLRRELGLAGTVVRVVPATDGGAIARALRRARRREAVR